MYYDIVHGNPLQYSCLGNPVDEDPGGLQSVGSPRVSHNLVTKQQHGVTTVPNSVSMEHCQGNIERAT